MVSDSNEVLVTVTGATVSAGPKSSRGFIFYGSALKKTDSRLLDLFVRIKDRAIKLYNEQASVELIKESEVRTLICELNRVLVQPKDVGGTSNHKDAYNECKSDPTDRVLLTSNPYKGLTQVKTTEERSDESDCDLLLTNPEPVAPPSVILTSALIYSTSNASLRPLPRHSSTSIPSTQPPLKPPSSSRTSAAANGK